MIRQTVLELFIVDIPEMLIFTWGVHIVARQKINIVRYISSSLIISILVFLVRMLPIYFGVHIVINNILSIIIFSIIGIPLVQAISSTFLITLLLSISEFLDMLLLSVLNIDIDKAFVNVVTKRIVTIPSLIIFLLLILLIRNLISKKEGNKDCI